MFTLIKEEVNSTFLPFDKFIDHRCCERVLSVFKPSAGQTEQRRFKPQINFRPSLALCSSRESLVRRPISPVVTSRISMFSAQLDVFWLLWMFFRRCLLYILPTSWPNLQFVRVELPVFIPGRHFLLPLASSPLFSG